LGTKILFGQTFYFWHHVVFFGKKKSVIWSDFYSQDVHSFTNWNLELSIESWLKHIYYILTVQLFVYGT